ncbi:hypothetical protein AMTR_s00072p00133220 [Amborella trichopoda]|uniref:Uncharacterized protein n=1 Tax=Amborella trichopoda TaxID=13333 RepID=W1NRE9_AMBTC|nr:hypothetical protein AMTR_s00072p00133220 [Amborella trichopoda]
MATGNPTRLVGSGKEIKWLPNKDTSLATSPLNSLAAQELGLALKGHRYPGNGKDDVPNRSGSAPRASPCMEGSFAEIESLIHKVPTMHSKTMIQKSDFDPILLTQISMPPILILIQDPLHLLCQGIKGRLLVDLETIGD